MSSISGFDFECIYNENGELILTKNTKKLEELWQSDKYMDYSWNHFMKILVGRFHWEKKFVSLNWNEFVLKITENN